MEPVKRPARRFRKWIATLVAVPSLWAGPGFGTIRKNKIELQTRQPAVVRLADTSIAFSGAATRQYGDVEENLLATLEAEMLANERTLVKKNTAAQADWVFKVRVTGFTANQPQERADSSGKNPLVTWTGSMNVAYQVTDHVGRVHDSGNVNAVYDREFAADRSGHTVPGTKIPVRVPLLGKKSTEVVPHSVDELKQILIHDVVRQIAAKVGNTTVSVEVQAAGGDEHLNRAVEFMERRLWSRALDELEKMPAFAKPEEEAYRQYDIGLVYEAMSYDAKTSADQRANLFKAAEYYDKALEGNTKEKYFVESVGRLKDSIARYKALDIQQKSAPPAAVTAKAPPKSGKVLRIEDVIEMYAAGVEQPQIIAVIRNSNVEFDPLDKDTSVAIAKAKLPAALQNEMRKKVGASPVGGTAAPAKKKQP